MASPFPGIDPYVEAQGLWTDFHPNLIGYIRDALVEHLPEQYVARVGERLDSTSWTAVHDGSAYPNALVADRGPRSDGPTATVTAVWNPTVIPRTRISEEIDVRYTWVEILHLPDQRLVTSLEVLTPGRKAGVGRAEYLAKFHQLWRADVNLVEIDLLRDGRPMPCVGAYPPGDFQVTLARSGRRPDCEVSAWSIRLAPPTIPIPLASPDPDIPLALAPLVARCYKRGRYDRTLDYSRPLGLPLSADDQAWADGLIRGDGA